jgi:hypothetical protein
VPGRGQLQPQLELGVLQRGAADLDRVLDHAMGVDRGDVQGQASGPGAAQIEKIID